MSAVTDPSGAAAVGDPDAFSGRSLRGGRPPWLGPEAGHL